MNDPLHLYLTLRVGREFLDLQKPKNPAISKAMVIQSGPIVTGQAAEFEGANKQTRPK